MCGGYRGLVKRIVFPSADIAALPPDWYGKSFVVHDTPESVATYIFWLNANNLVPSAETAVAYQEPEGPAVWRIHVAPELVEV